MSLEKFPGPPAKVKSSALTLREFEEHIFRTHAIARSPIHFANSKLNRFDSPDGSYGVLYAGRDPYCAFIESLAKPAGTRIITTEALQKRALSELMAARPLRLIDLTQSGALVRIGADARLFAADHAISQLWSKALHDHPIHADGLLYPSRLDPKRQALAIFQDRAPKIVELKRQSWYALGPHRQLLAKILDHYGLELIENRYTVPRKPIQGGRQNQLFPDDDEEA